MAIMDMKVITRKRRSHLLLALKLFLDLKENANAIVEKIMRHNQILYRLSVWTSIENPNISPARIAL